MKRLIYLFVISILIIGCDTKTKDTSDEPEKPTKTVHQTEVNSTAFGDKWPFTTSQATLKCYLDDGVKSPVVILAGKPFGLTGFADSMYGQKNLNALNEFWKKSNNGLMISLSAITKRAEALCDE